MKIPKDMVAGSVHLTNNYGSLEVISYEGFFNVRVRFVDTGYTTTAQSGCVRLGNVKDKLLPSIYGVGFIGVGSYKPSVNCKITKEYRLWVNMLKRCYCKIYQRNQPTYQDCSVCDEWHSYQVFADWLCDNYISGYHLDKDIKVKGNRVYGPQFCKFVTQSENNVEAVAKHYRFLSPDGGEVDIYNLSEFCKNNNLDYSCMSKVHNKKITLHKGWVKHEILANTINNKL